MALFTLHPLPVTLATSFSVVLVIVLAGVEMLDSLRGPRLEAPDARPPLSLGSSQTP